MQGKVYFDIFTSVMSVSCFGVPLVTKLQIPFFWRNTTRTYSKGKSLQWYSYAMFNILSWGGGGWCNKQTLLFYARSHVTLFGAKKVAIIHNGSQNLDFGFSVSLLIVQPGVLSNFTSTASTQTEVFRFHNKLK